MIKQLIAGAAKEAPRSEASLSQQLQHRHSPAHLAMMVTPGAGPSPTQPGTRLVHTRPCIGLSDAIRTVTIKAPTGCTVEAGGHMARLQRLLQRRGHLQH